MFPHHEASIANLIRHFESDSEVEAVLLGGSLAHGFATAASDIDLVLVVSDQEHATRVREGRLQFYDLDACTYPGGYAEGKYVAESFLEEVADHGSEPARFALHDARVLVARKDYRECLQRIGRYPVEGKEDRMRRFFAQLEAWHWYATEGLRLENPYLLGTAISKLVLFGGRLVLTHNELFYPYHKWFLRVLETAEDKPDGLMESIEHLHREPTASTIHDFRERIVAHGCWTAPADGWPTQFLIDSELNWRDGEPPVDDL
jgi:predicted nucleotidyltransferase